MHKLIFIFLSLYLVSIPANADLARAMSCFDNTSQKGCDLLLIAAIDANEATNQYCPDGKTSYGFLISAWERDLKLFPQRRSISTYESMALTIKSLNLSCK